MNFPPFWAKGSHQNFSCWRWSQRSLSEAEALAKEAARQLAERFASGNRPLNRYSYGDRPLREPVLRELKSTSGDVVAVITRNACGCLVLNAPRVMFVDVDLAQPRSSTSAGRWLARLLGRTPATAPNKMQDDALAKADAWIRAHPDWGWRIYRTRAGLRLLATHALFDPGAVAGEPVFDELGADPLYRQLCKTQNCFRARLTPSGLIHKYGHDRCAQFGPWRGARRAQLPQWICNRRATKPRAKFGATRRAACLFGGGAVARSLQILNRICSSLAPSLRQKSIAAVVSVFMNQTTKPWRCGVRHPPARWP